MRILGPLVCSSTSPVTATFARSFASVVTVAPSTTRATGSDTEAPASSSSFSTLTTSPTATLYCLPPVLTIAYVAIIPLRLWARGIRAAYVWVSDCRRQGLATTAQGYLRPASRVKSPQVTAHARYDRPDTTRRRQAHRPDSSSTTLAG